MENIHIDASASYDILIERGLLAHVGRLIKEVCGSGKAALIADDTVSGLYGEAVRTSMEQAGFEVVCYTFPHGEKSKNTIVYVEILEFLAQQELTRADLIVALGGGVTGDMAGFAAATYLRGIPFVQIPTTFLAAIDSSVGGKTAIDLKAGKNLAGTFYQPALVICDPDTLKTLPKETFAEGTAEAIKYGVILDEKLFYLLAQGQLEEHLEEVIARCVSLKRDVVQQDEYDTGIRQILNFGHTLGHGIEKASGFQISHGAAVGIGMVLVSRGAGKEDIAQEIEAVLKRYHLPTESPYGTAELLEAAGKDKKRFRDEIHLILPEEIGQCRIEAIPVGELEGFIDKALAKRRGSK